MTSTINERMNDTMKTCKFNPLSYSESRGVTGGLPEKKTEVRPQIKVERIAVDGIAEDVNPSSVPRKSSKLPFEAIDNSSSDSIKHKGIPDIFEKTLDRIKKRKLRRDGPEIDSKKDPRANEIQPSSNAKTDLNTKRSISPETGRTPQSFLNSLRAQIKAQARESSKVDPVQRIAGDPVVKNSLRGLRGDQALVKKFDDLLMKLRDQIQNGAPESESSNEFDLLVSQIKEKLEKSGI